MSKPKAPKPIVEQSEAYLAAFDYFNKKLFEDQLPRPMLLYTRNNNIIGGYYSPDKWSNGDGTMIDEIAINANLMADGNEVELFQVLIHEMSHLWQHKHGTPGRGGYHNVEWAEKAKAIGLKPYSTKDPEQETGDSITTKFIEGGPAMLAVANMPEEISIPWYAVPMAEPDGPRPESPKPEEPEVPEVPKAGKRTKYTCHKCGANIWGKAGLNIQCLDCSTKFTEMK
jgi:predicted SprT family Zn-dependent metalloprotease